MKKHRAIWWCPREAQRNWCAKRGDIRNRKSHGWCKRNVPNNIQNSSSILSPAGVAKMAERLLRATDRMARPKVNILHCFEFVATIRWPNWCVLRDLQLWQSKAKCCGWRKSRDRRWAFTYALHRIRCHHPLANAWSCKFTVSSAEKWMSRLISIRFSFLVYGDSLLAR